MYSRILILLYKMPLGQSKKIRKDGNWTWCIRSWSMLMLLLGNEINFIDKYYEQMQRPVNICSQDKIIIWRQLIYCWQEVHWRTNGHFPFREMDCTASDTSKNGNILLSYWATAQYCYGGCINPHLTWHKLQRKWHVHQFSYCFMYLLP
jgi:hypothetical protein